MSTKMQIPIHKAPDFSEFVSELGNGEVNDRLTTKMADLVRAVAETGRAGTLTIKLAFKRDGAAMASVAVEAKANIPEHPMNGSLFYIGEGGALLRDDPRQMTLRNLQPPKLRPVDGTNKE